jgi:hypothetical protein
MRNAQRFSNGLADPRQRKRWHNVLVLFWLVLVVKGIL